MSLATTVMASPRARRFVTTRFLEQARQLQLGQPDISVGIALDVAERGRIQPLDQPLGRRATPCSRPRTRSLDDRPSRISAIWSRLTGPAG
jgi:hypothetical protein